MSTSAFRQSLSVLRTTPVSAIPALELAVHYQNIAHGFSREFSKFSIEICGCTNPEDRVALKKSVWQQTVGMRLREFEKAYSNQRENLEKIAKMECPVNSRKNQTIDESSPSKIILASKLLRAHFNMVESTSCRGCSKRGRCPFSHKTVTNKSTKTSLGALTKVLFGISQSCRLYLKDPEMYPFVLSASEMDAAISVTEDIGKFIRPSSMERQLRNVPVADQAAVRGIIKKQLKKKQEIENEIKQKNKMPDWLRKHVGDPVGLEDADPVSPTKPKFDIDSDDWVPEESGEVLSKSNLKLPPAVARKQIVGDLTRVDPLEDIPVVQRFTKPTTDTVDGRRKPLNFEALFSTKQRVKSSTGTLTSPTSPIGGYSINPQDGIEYIKPQFLKGKTVLDNVGLAGKLWGSNDLSELKFLHRVPYVESVTPTSTSTSRPVQTPMVEELHVSPKRRPVNTTDSLFSEWRKNPRGSRKIPLIDREFENTIDIDVANVEIATLPKSASSLCNMHVGVSNANALEFALSNTKNRITDTDEFVKTESNISFPKLPNWDPSRGNMRSLMRPTTNKKSKGTQSSMEGKVRIPRKVSSAELAGVWN